MRDFTPGERFETDINRLCALADTGVIRSAQRNIHQWALLQIVGGDKLIIPFC
uniref:Uncharacterized protein n=1 Tax=Klebsiella pneumoniae TaxID=573 RepID=A0A7D5KI95_KLEPN|nr:hypothetical protein [Klebsiella pneumoniae]